MKSQTSNGSLIAGALAAVLFVLPAAAQDSQSTPSGTPAPAITNAAAAKSSVAPAAVKAPASGVADVLKMLEAGVSKDVLKTYVESSTVPYNLTSADVIALKEHGVTDDITVILLKRSAENRAQMAQAQAATAQAVTNIPVRIRPTRYMNSANLDPESEDYFQYYYLFPRTLANTYQTLGYSAGPYGYYGYSPYAAYGYTPFFGPGFGPRRFHRP